MGSGPRWKTTSSRFPCMGISNCTSGKSYPLELLKIIVFFELNHWTVKGHPKDVIWIGGDANLPDIVSSTNTVLANLHSLIQTCKSLYPVLVIKRLFGWTPMSVPIISVSSQKKTIWLWLKANPPLMKEEMNTFSDHFI